MRNGLYARELPSDEDRAKIQLQFYVTLGRLLFLLFAAEHWRHVNAERISFAFWFPLL